MNDIATTYLRLTAVLVPVLAVAALVVPELTYSVAALVAGAVGASLARGRS